MDDRTMLRYVDELQGQIDRLKKMVGGGGGGTKDYDKLNNRPKVNNITLAGNKKSSDLKIAYNMTESEYEAATKNAESIYFLQENAGTITDSAYVNLEVADWTEVSGVYKQTQPFVFEVTPAAGWTIEDVSIETGIASVDSYEVTADPLGLSITYVAETLPEYGITATVTVTINQPAGSTRIMKNGLQFGVTMTELYSGTEYAATCDLSDHYNNYDLILFVARYSGQTAGDHRITALVPAALFDDTDFTIQGHGWYVEVTSVDSDTVGVASREDGYLSKVYGIRF